MDYHLCAFCVTHRSIIMEIQQYALSALAAMLIGISKSGIKGIGVIIVTLMAIVYGAKASTGIVLPLLIVGDICAVIYYKKHTLWKILFKLLPWVVGGVILGAIVGKNLSEEVFKQGMAIIILVSVIMMYAWERRKSTYIPDNWYFAGSMGVAAGFTTMIGNLAGAFSNIYFLAMRLPKNQFIGTAAWLFFIINLFKVPFHIFSWETINRGSLLTDLKLFPFTIVGFFLGVRLVGLIKDQSYRYMIMILTALGALLIFFR